MRVYQKDKEFIKDHYEFNNLIFHKEKQFDVIYPFKMPFYVPNKDVKMELKYLGPNDKILNCTQFLLKLQTQMTNSFFSGLI